MNDETLLLYYYKDGLTRREREAVATRLATDTELSERYQSLCADLDSVDLSTSTTPSSDMLHRWHDAIDRAAERAPAHTPSSGFHFGSFFWGAVVTAALAIGIGIGIFVSGNGEFSEPREQPFVATPVPGDNGAFRRGLQVHLREAGQNLAALSDASSADRTSLLLKIIGQNRLFERSAELNDADDIARLLRAFDLVLMQLATKDISPEQSAALQSKLMFELNVVLTKLAGDTSNEPETI